MKENKPERARSSSKLHSNFTTRIQATKTKLKDFWIDNYDEIVSGTIVFLLVALSFGLGAFYGGKFYEDSSININCPPSFWEEGE